MIIALLTKNKPKIRPQSPIFAATHTSATDSSQVSHNNLKKLKTIMTICALNRNKSNFKPTPRDSNRPVWQYQRIYDVLSKLLKPQPQERICHSTELVFHKTEFQSRTLAVLSTAQPIIF